MAFQPRPQLVTFDRRATPVSGLIAHRADKLGHDLMDTDAKRFPQNPVEHLH
ncbi:hypothetical protein SACE_0881 [Saccharopolyspora erythraea NRRL 2338]|uniref:Uncharacterized protein n=1 Tax=Saccharopolyspora erythraea (strain ATCC 11635 / DSM 40517 / JCM 4748 / NBRC 13426 / NCIMB 8594 / NRRL 2338) TaxID=405948 RepID=A4F840_SACEN|nr:hypothetical protein SACE_0881 [Saccharopolyspora erythraea NRRL 2338]